MTLSNLHAVRKAKYGNGLLTHVWQLCTITYATMPKPASAKKSSTLLHLIVGLLSALPTKYVSTSEEHDSCNQVLKCDSFYCLLHGRNKKRSMVCQG